MKKLFFVFALLFFASPVYAATLNWTDASNNELGFKIERMNKPCTEPDEFVQIGEVGVNVSTYVDSTTQLGQKYCYRVRAWNLKFSNDPTSVQYSAYSNKGYVEYPLYVPADPSQLVVTQGQ